MWAIYRKFFWQMSVLAVKIFAACALLGLIAYRFDYPGFAALLALIPLVITFHGAGLMAAHLQLFLGFPYSRGKLIAFTAALNWTALGLSSLTLGAYALVLTLVDVHYAPGSGLQKFLADLRSVPLRKALNEAVDYLATPSGTASLLLFLSVLLSFSFMAVRKPGPGAAGLAKLSESRYLNAGLIVGLLGVLLYGFAYSSYLLYCLGFAFLGMTLASFLTDMWIQPSGRARRIKLRPGCWLSASCFSPHLCTQPRVKRQRSV